MGNGNRYGEQELGDPLMVLNVRALLEPIGCNGALGLWYPEKAIIKALHEQLPGLAYVVDGPT